MPLNPLRPIQSACNRATVFQGLALAFCVLFGLSMIANTLTAGDGGWFWYANSLLSGKRLYADLHLAQQPLFPLETSYFLALLGKGWLASKVPAVLHLLAYCVGLLLLARASTLSDRQKAIILACAFFVSIDFVGYRFDDYHVLADCFQVYSIYLLLILEKASAPGPRLRLAAALGILSGLSLMSRPNDGAALVVGVVIAVAFLVPANRIVSIALYGMAATLTIVLVVRSSGDSLHDWANYSLFHVAANKGGTGHVFADPLRLPWNTVKYFWNPATMVLALYLLVSVFAWITLVRPIWRNRQPSNFAKLFIGAVIILGPALYLRHVLVESSAVLVIPPLGVLPIYGIGLAVVVRVLCRWLAPATIPGWTPREILLLIPLGQLASGSMSTGAEPLGLNGPLAMTILLLPIASPIHLKREPPRAYAFALVTLITVLCVAQKYLEPFSWHSYKIGPMFVGRQWYHHPDYGPMVIERDNLAFIQPVCDAVKADGAQQGLLSLPYPYPNYFCAIPPWHGYVQTFFDISTRATIEGLMAELQTSPPKWILYQRQLVNLALHERIYNHGAPLPHRDLDEMIERKIASGEWHVVYTSNFEDRPNWDNHWLLIRTHP